MRRRKLPFRRRITFYATSKFLFMHYIIIMQRHKFSFGTISLFLRRRKLSFRHLTIIYGLNFPLHFLCEAGSFCQ